MGLILTTYLLRWSSKKISSPKRIWDPPTCFEGDQLTAILLSMRKIAPKTVVIIWMFPKIGGVFSPKSSHLFIGFSGFPLFSPSILGGFPPIFGSTPILPTQKKMPYYYQGEIPWKNYQQHFSIKFGSPQKKLGFFYMSHGQKSLHWGWSSHL